MRGCSKFIIIIFARSRGGWYIVADGNSTTLDMQQLATHARDASLMTADDIAISVVAEVASSKSSSTMRSYLPT
jgi:hypothetical protein